MWIVQTKFALKRRVMRNSDNEGIFKNNNKRKERLTSYRIITSSVPRLNPKPKTATFPDPEEPSPRMKVTSHSLGIVSLVGYSGGRRFLPAEAAVASAIRGGARTGVGDRRNVKEGRQRNVRRVKSENDDRGGGLRRRSSPRARRPIRPPRAQRIDPPPKAPMRRKC